MSTSAATSAAGAPPGVQPKNGLGAAAMVLGIVGLVLSLIPLLFFIGFPLGILAVIFGAIGIRRGRRGEATNRGQAIAGLVTGLIACVIAIIAIATIGSAVHDLDNSLNKSDTITNANPATFQTAQQQVDRQEQRLIHRGMFITNQ